MPSAASRVTVFGPNPMLSVTIEARAGAGDEDVHLHAGGQGVWVSRTAGALGAAPVLCGFAGGEAGAVLRGLLAHMPVELRLVETAAPSVCSVIDRRSGAREVVSMSWTAPPTRHELDDLCSRCIASALDGGVLVICNPWPGDALPLEVYANLVSDARANGTPVLVDLSTPRLDAALEGKPDLVKLNDWELAEYVSGPVNPPDELAAAARRLLAAGAGTVVVTRGGEPAYAFRDGDSWELVPPRLERGFREGCGDAMMGAMAAVWGRVSFEEALRIGGGAGAASFLRHGLGSATRDVIEELAAQIELRRL